MAKERQFSAEKAGINPTEINLESVGYLFSDVARYNQENSSKTILSNLLIKTRNEQSSSYTPALDYNLLSAYTAEPETLERQEEVTSKERQTFIENFNDSLDVQRIIQSTAATGIFLTYESLLTKLGLSTQLVKDKNTIIIANKNNYLESNQIRFNITNTQKFLSFLDNLDPETIDNNLKNGLEDLLKNLTCQLVDHFTLSQNTQTLKFILNIRPIIDQYKRLKLDKATDTLTLYLHYLKMGILKEYLMLENQGCLVDKDDYSNPSTWQATYSLEFFQQKWIYVLGILRKIAQKPKAYNSYSEFIKYFQSCAETSLSRTKNADFIPEDEKIEYSDILTWVIKKLEGTY